jgi:hypothetical protein
VTRRQRIDDLNQLTPKADAAHWQRRLEILAARHRVPGATLGILWADEVVEAGSPPTAPGSSARRAPWR